jgi:hypothetical protein
MLADSRSPLSNPVSPPVAIGGVGGSGTRIVALLIQGMGYFLGQDLNPALDNLWFTLLFKRPGWFRRVSGRPAVIHRIIRSFRDAMMEGLSPSRALSLLPAAFHTSLLGNNYRRSGRGLAPYRRVLHMKRGPNQSFSLWGWKEPNTQNYQPYLSNELNGVKYVHVIRHGLDMAFSSNIDQLCNWGWMFSLDTSAPSGANPERKFSYWLAANRRAFDIGMRLMPGRFLIVDFDRLCQEPVPALQTIAEFLGYPLTSDRRAWLVSQISPLEAQSRYGDQDLSWLTKKHEAGLNELGYRR